jgi:type 1 glutamine amidotransferase
LAAWVALCSGATAADPSARSLRVLLVTGGCCHEYGSQKDILKKGLESRARVQVDQVHNSDRSAKARFAIYANPEWAEGYDVVIHDECTPDVKDVPYVRNILQAHRKVPAVNLHCAMHSYRSGTDDWYKFVGIQSNAHGPQVPIAIHFSQADHPVTRSLAGWTTIPEELYNNVQVLDTARPLIWGRQVVKQKDGEERVHELVVAWTNQYGGTRVFSTTLGHNSQTVADDRYLDLVTRGLLWAGGKLEPAYLRTPAAVSAD